MIMRSIFKADRLSLAMLCVLAGLLCVGCTGLGLRAKYESFESDLDFDDDYGDPQFNQERAGVELTTTWFRIINIFLEGGTAYKEIDESGSDIDADGYYAAAGFKSPNPESSGFKLDYRGRIGYYYVDDSSATLNLPAPWGAVTNADTEFYGYDVDGNLGVGYAFELGVLGLIFMPRGGVYTKNQVGEFKWKAKGLGKETVDYDVYSVGGYLGATFLSDTLLGLDISGMYYKGSEEMEGFMIAGGFYF
jgi:hypothetical protein